MQKAISIGAFILFFGSFFSLPAFSGGPLDPVRLGTWVINAGVGPGAHYFGNGVGFGPALKGSVEKGMWDLGPGVITLGGEVGFSFFSHRYGNGWNESWVNFIFAARGAYHYGWDVEGLDTYGGIPLGIGFCAHAWDNQPGSRGYTPVYPYAGVFFGASYFFTKTIGVNGEVGYNSTYANIGVVYKLK
ncbi:MAG: hypothetical protein Q8M08_11670 [Bacteroidales bacterium]|nr:hypothetical protein [Bacteroidales bacterium]